MAFKMEKVIMLMVKSRSICFSATGTKTIEIRLYDEKRSQLKLGIKSYLLI